MNYKLYSFVKLLLLVASLMLAGFLAFVAKDERVSTEHSLVFILDVNRTMNTQDVVLDNKKVSRIFAAKEIVRTMITKEPWVSYGLILFNGSTDYIVPPTFDIETFFLYLTGISTNLLPNGDKDFLVLSSVLFDRDLTSYVVLSDFDGVEKASLDLPDATLLIGLGTVEGDYVRYSNGVRYYDNGVSVSSVRNDSVARSFGVTYIPVTTLDDFSLQKIIFGGVHLPISQRIFLYVLLGILVILVVMF